MRIFNDAHITLHEEAARAMAQAEAAGWDAAYIGLIPSNRYPFIAFSSDSDDIASIRVTTTPGFVSQVISYEPARIEINYNQPVLSLAQAQAILAIVEPTVRPADSPEAQ